MAKRGRPAGFDRAEALHHAMELVWARGYEGATLGDLQAAMGGISPPSFYHAFGSKEALFKEVAELTSPESAPHRCARWKMQEPRERASKPCSGVPSSPLLNPVNPRAASSTAPPSALPRTRAHRPICWPRAGTRLRALHAGSGAPSRTATFRRAPTFVALLNLRHPGPRSRGQSRTARRAGPMAAVDGAMAGWAQLAKPQQSSSNQTKEPKSNRRAESVNTGTEMTRTNLQISVEALT